MVVAGWNENVALLGWVPIAVHVPEQVGPSVTVTVRSPFGRVRLGSGSPVRSSERIPAT
jgi:hypothetical protein